MRKAIMMVGLVGLFGCVEKHVAAAHSPPAQDASAVDAFHGRMSPIWHQEDPTARQVSACSAASSLTALADRITSEPPPPRATPAFSEQAKGLTAATRNLESACATQSDVAGALKAMHDAYHAVSACSGN